ncbi:NHS-like protein 1 isoform X3 [Spea bombifrons]|uniref:NHS-like protein 1 isoform X3 n=1 Tax=Spea bombifrons TaxID=233779 RepID=UPI002349AD0B|nr:NHS-like protein 1 isoform X3 [Spea bombifrons]
MIAYIHCLPADPMVGCLHRAKWQAYCDEEEQELIPLYTFKMGNSVTKKNGRSRKKLSSEEDNEFWPTVSNLDEESKWAVHYTAGWHQQENVFLPSSRPPCVEDLHREAKLNLKTVLRECDKLRRDGYRSSQYYSQGPTFSSSNMVCTHYQEDDEQQDRKFSVSSSEEEKLLPGKRPKTPVSQEFSDTHTNWTKSLPLPTPEEKMRQEAQAIQTDVIPINVSGENFDRQASFRRSLIHTDTVVRRQKKVKRRKTITGVPDNIQKELAAGTGQKEFRGHSLHIPDDYNPLDTCRPAIQRTDMRDFSCQTDDIKVIPPSVRRIRAQKGQGIAALMSSSSGNMSTLNDSAGSSPRVNGELNFRSLPRPGARVCLQSLEQKPGEINQIEDSFISLPRQLSKLQVDNTVIHLRNNPRAGSLQRPKSQEVRGSEDEVFSNPACTVSPHAAYSTSVIPNAMLSSSSEVIAIHTSQSTGQLESKVSPHCSSSHSKTMCRDRNVSVKDVNRSLSGNYSSTRHSQTSDTMSPNAVTVIAIRDSRNLNNIPQAMSYKIDAGFNSHSQDSDTHSESSCSDGRQRNGSITSSIASADHWSYEMGENDPRGLSRKLPSAVSSSPVSNMSTCSSERKADTSSLYSVDHDGYYTSMHVDSGISSCSQNNIIHNPRHSVINIFDKKDTGSVDSKSNYSDRSLTRSISLKKPKKPPPPPSRTDSLRRPPKKHVKSNGQVLSETLIASLQQSLHLNLKGKTSSSASQSPCSDYEDPWVLRSRSQSTVSASSSGMSATATNLYSICAVTPSQSETSSIKSEYADQWSYVIDYARTSDEQPKHSPSRSSGINDYNTCEVRCGVKVSMPKYHGGIAKPNGTSPEKPCRVTSPSSGYSSQSNTPTTLTPVPALLKNMSPGNVKNKMKPKVPERRSSLISSVSISSSSTSLSSNTSDSIQQSVKKSNVILTPLHTPPTPPLTPDPPSPPCMDVVDIGTVPSSPNFPPPPPEVTMFPSIADETSWAPQSQNTDKCSPVSCPPPPPPLIMHSKVPPPAPPLNTKVLKTKIETTLQRKEENDKPLNNQDNKQELLRPVTPLVTTHALQMVQLRSVKKSLKLENEKLAEQEPEPKPQNETSSLFSRPSLVPSATLDLNTSVYNRENKNCNTTDELQSSEFQSNTVTLTTVKVSAEKTFPEQKCEDLYQTNTHNGNTTIVSEMSSPEEKPSTSQTTPNASPNKKPPPVSKKPKLFLIVPPPQLDLAGEKIAQVNENVRSLPNASERESTSEHCEEVDGRRAAENDPKEAVGLAYPVGEAGLSSCEVEVENIFLTPHLHLETQNLQKEGEQLTMSEVVHTPESKTASPRCDQKVLEEEESVFETGNISASPLQTSSCKEDNKEQVMTPTRPRTTEDLFAAIHRSKRKILGRKDSDDDRRNHSPSPPVTPTGGPPNISTFKQTGAIQRSIRKSSTSSDNFKALLLKKGSRSECGSRMSAAEMLKHTDPRFQRSMSDTTMDHPESPTLTSPNKNKRAQEEWAKSEGLMPRSMSVSGTRYSRSRTPPSAASSKYNVRSRLQSSPMTVICEGEGEAVDTVESFPKMPLIITKSLDRFDRSDSGINESVDSEGNNDKVDIDLMSRLLQSEEKS